MGKQSRQKVITEELDSLPWNSSLPNEDPFAILSGSDNLQGGFVLTPILITYYYYYYFLIKLGVGYVFVLLKLFNKSIKFLLLILLGNC